MKAFVVIISVLLVLLYLQYYVKYKQDYQILQVFLDNFKLDTLYEKYPIVVYDQVYDTGDLLKTVFAYSFVFKKEFDVEPSVVYRNSHKFVVLSCEDSVSIKVINPKYKKDIKARIEDCNVQFITVKLKQNQVLILPALWYYHTENMDVRAISLDDLVSKWLYALV